MTNSAWTSGLWFVAILLMIPAALWLLKRSPVGARFSGMATGAGAMRQIASLPLSAQHRIVTVEVGQGDARRWLVLGVTPQQISRLHAMLPPDGSGDPDGAHVTATAPLPGFGQLLGRLRQDRGRP